MNNHWLDGDPSIPKPREDDTELYKDYVPVAGDGCHLERMKQIVARTKVEILNMWPRVAV